MIRRMLEKDIPEVVKIEETVFADHWKSEAFHYELKENPFSIYWVAQEGEKIIGFAGMWITFETAQITNIAVLPEYAHQGYGQLLMDQILHAANDGHCEVISLEVRVSNEVAIQFYKKNGFIQVNVKKGYYRNNYEDAYYMLKPLRGAK